MQKLIFVMSFLALIVLGMSWAFRPTSQTDTPSGPVPAGSPQAAPSHAATQPQPKPLRIPKEFDGFETWTSKRQLDAVTDIQRNAHLSPDMRDFLVDLAADPSRRPVLRNNAANAIGIQHPPVAGWLGRLADQAIDPTESPIWRDYALQHLSDQLVPQGEAKPVNGDFIGSPDSGLDRKRYVDVLTTVASGNQIVAGTALLHLDRLNREEGLAIDQAQFHALLLRMLEDETIAVGAKVTAFGILSLRKDPADAAIARTYLRDPRSDVRRAATAALGNLGTVADIPAIEAVDAGSDPTVDLAKKAACKRLTDRGANKQSGL